MSLRLVFIMDPIEHIQIDGDSTFALMLEARRRGHAVYYTRIEHLALEGRRAEAWAHPAELRRVRGNHATLGPGERLALDDVDAVFMRKDPPFDVQYLMNTYILDRVSPKVVMVNHPQGLRDANEKVFPMLFPELMPRTLVARDPARLKAFIAEVGDVVLKPLTGAGGFGVVHVARNDKNTSSIIDLLTELGRVAITAQAYLPRVSEGDRRIVLVDGEPVGVINRRPQPNELRSNMHVGGTAEPARLTDRDLEICARIGPELERRGLVFVGIDVIDGHLTEINVTSPTGIQEIDRFDGVSIEGTILDWVEARAKGT